MSDESRGDCHVVVYLADFTMSEVEQLMTRIADVLMDEMEVIRADDDEIRALIGAKPLAFPDIQTDAFLDEHATFVIPFGNPA